VAGVILGTDLYVAQNIAFGIIAALMIISALRVVTTNNVVHAALYLVLVLSGAAAQYLLLAAEFVAVTQVLVYVGAVMVLFLFGVMLTRAQIGGEANLNNTNWFLGIPVGLVLLGTLTYALVETYEDERLVAESPLVFSDGQSSATAGIGTISDSIFSPYLLPFWALSFVLLAAVVGAIVLARKD
jgi:NADH-quinone oxidoreductase subunit J